MKRILLPLLAALSLPTAVEANWFGKYGSYYEAKEACDEWRRSRDEPYVKNKSELTGKIGNWNSRDCEYDSETRQVLGLEKKFQKDKIYTLFQYDRLPEVVKKRFRY